MNNELSKFSYLWDGTAPEWALLQVNPGSAESPKYVIVNTQTRAAKLIEDNALFAQVVQAMLSSGVRVVSVGNGF